MRKVGCFQNFTELYQFWVLMVDFSLRTLFTSLEQHLLHSLDLFSLTDLIRVHNKDMSALLEPIVYYAKCHIEACEVRLSS